MTLKEARKYFASNDEHLKEIAMSEYSIWALKGISSITNYHEAVEILLRSKGINEFDTFYKTYQKLMIAVGTVTQLRVIIKALNYGIRTKKYWVITNFYQDGVADIELKETVTPMEKMFAFKSKEAAIHFLTYFKEYYKNALEELQFI